MDIVEFLRARLDEDDRALRQEPPSAWSRNAEIAVSVEIHWVNPDRRRREIEAKRQILDRLEDQMVVDYVWTEYQEVTLPLLASVYADHPDYRQEWKP